MKFRNRLIISFCIILFVPVLLAVLMLSGIMAYQKLSGKEDFAWESEYFSNSLQMLSRYAADAGEELEKTAEEEPDSLVNIVFLERWNNRLAEEYSYLIVRKGGTIIYYGANGQEEISEQDLPGYGYRASRNAVCVYANGSSPMLLRQLDFVTTQGETGSLFIVTTAKTLLPEVKKKMLDFLISVLLILIFTAMILIIWTYSGIVPKVDQLIKAAENIKEGNLDFEIETRGKDELSALSEAFEEMRRRLWENAQEKLHAEQEQKGLISNIAHDLKTPITAIKGYAEGILDGVADTPEKQERYLRTIYHKANEMNTLINELTLYSKIDTNKIPYHFQKLNVRDYFGDCAEELGMDLENQHIHLSYFNYVDSEVLIIADPEQLTRVIHNIIGNSIKYMRAVEAGVVNLRVQDVGDFVQIEIEDNGKGIAAKDLPYVFDRFYRADASRNSAAGGSGIGLSIVKKIIEDHGGKIWATSKESVGTTMYFVLRKYQEVINE